MSAITVKPLSEYVLIYSKDRKTIARVTKYWNGNLRNS